jgi:hypothetical protein
MMTFSLNARRNTGGGEILSLRNLVRVLWALFAGRRSKDARRCVALAAIDEADLSEFGCHLRREALYELREQERRLSRRHQKTGDCRKT